MKAKKKIISAALAVSMAAIAVAGSSLAYFTDNDEKTNTFTIGNVDIMLTEPNWDATGSEEAKNMYPGEAVAKDPTITNMGKNPAFVRVKVEWPEGVAMNYRTDYVEGKLGDNWVYNAADGWFYYEGILAPAGEAGNTTDALFDQVVLSTSTTNDGSGEGKDIKVYAEAIQAQGAAVQWKRVEAMKTSEIADWFNTHKQLPYDEAYAK